MRFALATLWRHGSFGPAHVVGVALCDPEVAALLPRIFVAVKDHHNASFPTHRMADVTLTLTDGRILTSGDVHARGGLDAPISDTKVAAKLYDFASPTLGTARAAKLWAIRDHLLRPTALFKDTMELLMDPP
ncbi:MAG: hypothetical protein AB8B58_01450 [Roseobacter sp.]